jgi:type I restriction enzyme S subunit
MVSLGEVASIERSTVQPADIPDGETYVGLENITSRGSFVGVGPVEAGELKSGKFRFDDGHLLYGKLRPYLAKVAAPEFSGVCSTDILPVRPGSQIDRSFLLHFLRTPAMVAHASKLATGANLPRLSPKALAEFAVPLPPIEEQRRIAAVLDVADALRAKRRQALAKLDTLTQAIFIDMFGDPVANPKGWRRMPLGTLLDSIDSGKSPVCLDRRAEQDEWAVLKLGAVTWCEYDDSQNKALPPDVVPETRHEVMPGDLLFTRKNTRELVGSAALVHSTRARLLLSDLIFRLRITSDAPASAAYLHQLLITPSKRREIQRLAGGSAGSMPNISKARLLALEVEVPPIEMQEQFARTAASVRVERLRARLGLRELDKLFGSLQQRAFRGEL